MRAQQQLQLYNQQLGRGLLSLGVGWGYDWQVSCQQSPQLPGQAGEETLFLGGAGADHHEEVAAFFVLRRGCVVWRVRSPGAVVGARV